LCEVAASGEIETLLRWFPVKAGETYFSPARTVHAIGAGIALCEIQQNYLVTYRLYDYGRPRELHLDAAVAVADLGQHPGPGKPSQGSTGRQLLVSCEHFETELLDIERPTHSIQTKDSAFLVFLEGSGSLAGEAFRAGEVWLIPAGNWQLETLQSPTRALQVRWPNR
jgi:mannose-6-phosphate isomerase